MHPQEDPVDLFTSSQNEIALLRREIDELKNERGILIVVMREIMKSPDHAREVAHATLQAMTRGYHG
jgi:hypothetical protein